MTGTKRKFPRHDASLSDSLPPDTSIPATSISPTASPATSIPATSVPGSPGPTTSVPDSPGPAPNNEAHVRDRGSPPSTRPPGYRVHRAAELDAHPRVLPAVHTLLEAFFRAASVAGDVRFAVELAVVEVVTNVIAHAYPGGEGRFSLSLTATESGVEVELRDQGLAVPVAPAKLPAWESEGGRGMVIARTAMDHAVSSRTADGVNVLRLLRGWTP